jgi:hypothetical protein
MFAETCAAAYWLLRGVVRISPSSARDLRCAGSSHWLVRVSAYLLESHRDQVLDEAL